MNFYDFVSSIFITFNLFVFLFYSKIFYKLFFFNIFILVMLTVYSFISFQIKTLEILLALLFVLTFSMCSYFIRVKSKKL